MTHVGDAACRLLSPCCGAVGGSEDGSATADGPNNLIVHRPALSHLDVRRAARGSLPHPCRLRPNGRVEMRMGTSGLHGARVGVYVCFIGK